MNVPQTHYHVWTGSLVGQEYGNAVYEHPIDAALQFTQLAVAITKYNPEITVTIEDAMISLEQGKGMRVGTPGFAVLLSRCSVACKSPLWN